MVVLSEALWRSRFGSDPALVGSPIRLNGEMFTVIGVVPAESQISLPGNATPGPVSLWTLLNAPQNRGPAQRYPHYLQVIGRLKPGVMLEAARIEMRAIAEAIARETPATNEGHGIAVDPLRQGVIGPELRMTSMLLLGVVAFVLLLCCANVANLLLARTKARARELAVRSALGAGRRRIIRLLLTESLVLAAFGTIAGAAAGAGIIQIAPALMPTGLLPAATPLAFDFRVLVFCTVTACVIALLCGFAPAWQAMTSSLAETITFSSRTATPRRSRFRTALAAGEVAVAVLLLYGAALLLRTLITLENVDPGYNARNVLTMVISPPAPRTPESMQRFYDTIEREVRNIPGVRDAGWGSALPLDGRWYGQSFQIEGDPPRLPVDRYNAGYQIVSWSYFETLDVPMVRGRGFTDQDTAQNPQVCIVNEAFVRRYLAGREPLSMRLAVQGMGQPSQAVVREIVGVVRQIKERPDEPEGRPHIYVPLAQNPWWSASLVVRPTDGRAATLTPAVRAAVARVDKERPVSRVRTLEDIEWEATSRPRFRAMLVTTFSALALSLAMVGVFGVLAYSVQQRAREFGVRIALGATTMSVLRLVLAGAARITVAGVALGLVAAAWLSRSIASLLFGISPLDP